MEIQSPYHVFLDYKGYLIEPRSYRVVPAPLMGTKFYTGRQAYAGLDFWQVGAMTDFTHGINQKFLVDPSAFFLSVGIDPSKPGEIKLERDLAAVTLPATPGVVTAQYRASDAIYLGTSTGKILKSVDGVAFTTDHSTGSGQIYGFYEIAEPGGVNKIFATKGSGKTWCKTGDTWAEAKAPVSGVLTFTNASDAVTGDADAKFTTELWVGCKIMLVADAVWFEVKTITDDQNLVLTVVYSEAGGAGVSKLAVENLYFTMVESDYGFGLFNDGIRRSMDGLTWIPIPIDPLWELPSSEGVALNAVAIPRGFIIGSKRGLWVFVGGSSGINLWLFPDYVSTSNFKGMAKWGHYAIFSVEKQGIFYTDGVQVFPTNLNYLNEGFVFQECNSIITSGWDMFALVSDGPKPLTGTLTFTNTSDAVTGTGTAFETELWIGAKIKLDADNDWVEVKTITDDTHLTLTEAYTATGGSGASSKKTWYLARCNLNYSRVPKYWWLVKKLDKEPAYLASYSDEKVLVFYEDATAEVYNKISGAFQDSGYLITSLIDENLIRLQKLYKSLSAIFELFEVGTTVKLGYRFITSGDFTEETFSGADQRESVFLLRNPTVDNRIQIKITLEDNEAHTKSPIVADLCWTYILENPSEEDSTKKNFYFTVLGEDKLEKQTGEIEEVGLLAPRSRETIVDDIWVTRAKKELLNFVGADNKRELGLTVTYVGSGTNCLITIDRTNFEITTYVDTVLDQTIDYKDKTIKEISDIIHALSDYTSEVHQDQEDSRTAHDFEPVKELELSGSAYIHVGSDIHSVIFNTNSPGQVKLAIDGRGSDRLQMSLRET